MKGFSIKIIKTIKIMFFLMMLMWLSGFIREYQLYTRDCREMLKPS